MRAGKFSLVLDFVSRDGVLTGLHRLLGGQFWLAKRAVELAAIGWQTSRQFKQQHPTRKRRTIRCASKAQKKNVSFYAEEEEEDDSVLTLIDAVGMLFAEIEEEGHLGKLGSLRLFKLNKCKALAKILSVLDENKP